MDAHEHAGLDAVGSCAVQLLKMKTGCHDGCERCSDNGRGTVWELRGCPNVQSVQQGPDSGWVSCHVWVPIQPRT